MTFSSTTRLFLHLAASALVASVLACTGGSPPATPVEGEGEGEDQGNCVAPVAGAWSGNGSCFGMAMTNTTDVSGCELTFRDWNMAMSVPLGAIVSGSDVTFSGDGWSDCTGTISTDGMAIAGNCSDGCELNLTMSP